MVSNKPATKSHDPAAGTGTSIVLHDWQYALTQIVMALVNNRIKAVETSDTMMVSLRRDHADSAVPMLRIGITWHAPNGSTEHQEKVETHAN